MQFYLDRTQVDLVRTESDRIEIGGMMDPLKIDLLPTVMAS